MVGSVASSSPRSHGVDRFYNPPALRRQLQLLQQQQKQQEQQQQQSPPQQPQLQLQLQQKQQEQQQQQPQRQSQLQRPEKLKTKAAAAAAATAQVVEVREVESRIDSYDSSSKPSVSASPSPPPRTPPRTPPPTGNLDRFLESTTPVVPAQCFLKTSTRSRRNGETKKFHSYFSLGDLWESFREWSAYGAGVQLILNGGDSVIQYYVPYLSGIQLYVDSSRHRLRHRHPGEDSDIDLYRGTSSECGADRRSEHACDVGGIRHITDRINGILLGGKPKSGQEGSPSVDTEVHNTLGVLAFEYLEREPPYGREPLADKISLLARQFPELKTYNSCDLLPASWMSVAWYPIYRIPTGPTLRDLDACFLTFHSLSTLPKDISNHPDPSTWSIGKICNAIDNPANLSLSIFGLASYKFRGSIWTPSGLLEQQQATSLLQAADNWLRLLKPQSCVDPRVRAPSGYFPWMRFDLLLRHTSSYFGYVEGFKSIYCERSLYL